MDVIAAEPTLDRRPIRFLTKVYLLEGLGSVGGNLLMYGIFFYMQRRFGWGAERNLMFSSAQGGMYVIGALAANPLSRWMDRQKLLRAICVLMGLIGLAGAWAPDSRTVVILLLAYVMLAAAQWPLLESLISIGANPHQLSRRISIYNLTWSGTGAITVAACGLIIAGFPKGIFLITAIAHAVCVVMLIKIKPESPHAPHVHLDPEPELVPLRTLAKRLSRIALPATFAVIYAMGAIMPTLPVIQSASPAIRTLIASVWMMSRWFTFVFLGATIWWHIRPRALLVAAMVLLIAFLGITLLSSAVSMILWQIALGAAMGLIYSASLYFGMVLSDGSTAQNAYHEALIGVGSILGPGCGALAGRLCPGSPHAAIFAVATILGVSVLGACTASLHSRR